MFSKHIRVIYLDTKEGRETLHFYELRLQFISCVYAYAEIKGDHMRMIILIRHLFMRRNSTLRQLFEGRSCKYINNTFTGVNDLFPKYPVNKYRRFRYAKFDNAWVLAVK